MHTWQRHLVLTCALAAAALVLAGAAQAWTWPLTGPVLRPYVFDPELPLEPGQHRGVDVQGTLGAAVLAPVDGRVSFAGTVPSGGRTITIETRDGYSATLLHLGPMLVDEGAEVAEGATVALAGSSGVPEHAVPYVHFGIRLTADPQGYLDPQLLLPPLGAPSAPVDPLPPTTPQPAPSTQPPATAPPAAAPPRVVPAPADGAPPRTATPVAGVPQRPVPQADAAPTVAAAPSVAATPAAPEVSAPLVSPRPAALAVRPTDSSLSPAPDEPSPLHVRHPAHQGTPEAHPRPAWVRVADPFAAPSERAAQLQAPDGRSLPGPGLVATLATLLGLISICACAFARRAARIIGGDALLPDDADLLREREPAHRARVHDDRGGRARPAPQAAR